MGNAVPNQAEQNTGRMALQNITVLVVDDESSIRRTVTGVLRDEGCNCIEAEDGERALDLIRTVRPDLIMLDIWMPGLDGIEALKRIREIDSDIPVIMMSGHATIATAVTATRLGAADFIEKPLDLNLILRAVHNAVDYIAAERDGSEAKGARESRGEEGRTEELKLGDAGAKPKVKPIVFEQQNLRGRKIPQRTLRNSAILYGQGLHSGKKSGLILEPLPANSGIHFVGVSEGAAVPAHVDYVESTGFATTIKLGTTQAATIEHIMSALHAFGISNLLIKCNGEVPVMDGSAKEFCSLIEEIGLDEQQGDWYEIEIKEPFGLGNDREYIRVEPASEFIIDYTLHYPAPIGKQRMVFTLNDIESYKREIAPARTFGFVKDIGTLQKQGLALGGRFDNFVLIGESGAINDTLRFSDEPVRHKILDMIGDLYLLGRRIRGKVTASMTGHSDNISLLQQLRERLKAE